MFLKLIWGCREMVLRLEERRGTWTVERLTSWSDFTPVPKVPKAFLLPGTMETTCQVAVEFSSA